MNTISSLMPKPNYKILSTYNRTNNTVNQFQQNSNISKITNEGKHNNMSNPLLINIESN